jgi:UDP-3-O-[3-hydroxymyristoyl] N-acetylglucosamine deacetylase
VVSKQQQTIVQQVEIGGIGLHSGLPVQVTLCPAEPDQGRTVWVQWHDGMEVIPAHISAVQATQLSTELAGNQARVRTIEHLLSALWGAGVDNVQIRIKSDQPMVEIPILDGSALPWLDSIETLGQNRLQNPGKVVTTPVEVHHQGSFVVAMPSPHLQFTYGIEFADCPIGRQWCSWLPEHIPFREAIAPARTFTLAKYIEPMRAQGLIKGGSLENAIVCDDKTWLNPPLRFADEPCRHKLLDLIGDLSLLGHIPQAHYIAYKASHHLHCQLAKQLLLL